MYNIWKWDWQEKIFTFGLHLWVLAVSIFGEFNDSGISNLLSLPGKDNPLFIISVGYST